METLVARHFKAFGLPGAIDPGSDVSKSSCASRRTFIWPRRRVIIPKNAQWAVRGKTNIVTTIAIAMYIETGMSKLFRILYWVKGKRGPMLCGTIRKSRWMLD